MKRETPPASTAKKMSKPRLVPAKPAATNVVPMPSAGTSPRAASARARSKTPAPEAIALRAYQLFEARQYQHGHDLDDWLQAEYDLTTALKTPKRKASA
jgi:hypothetical protein